MKVNSNPIFLVFLLSSFFIITYGLDVKNNNSVQESKPKASKDYFLGSYYWDMPEDSVFATINTILSLKYQGLDYLVFQFRHHTGRWGTQEFRFKDNKLYEYIIQWNNRGEHGVSVIMGPPIIIANITKISDSSFVFNKEGDTIKQLFQRIQFHPYRIELEWNLKSYDLKKILEKNINYEDRYNYFKVFTKPQHENTKNNIKITNNHLIFGNTKDSVISYEKSIGYLEPIYQGYNNLIYPNNKLNNKKGSIEFRFDNNKLVKIVEQWSGFSDNEIKKMNTSLLKPGYGKQITQFEITNQELNKVIDENIVSYSSDLDIGKYQVVVKKVLLESSFINFIQNFTHNSQNNRIISYDIHKVYNLCEE